MTPSSNVGGVGFPQKEDTDRMGRVLVVDDEPDVLLLCRLNLQHEGTRCSRRSEGRRPALELARERHPDVIVLDLMMPGVDGYDVLEALQARRRRPQGIPVLVLTAKSLRADRERSHGLGAAAFLTKPFAPERALRVMVDSPIDPVALAEHGRTRSGAGGGVRPVGQTVVAA